MQLRAGARPQRAGPFLSPLLGVSDAERSGDGGHALVRLAGVWQRHGLLTKHDRLLLRLEKATAERKLSLSEEQIRLLERFSPEFRERHIEAPHTGAVVAVDTFFVGVLKGVGKVYLQTAMDCRSRHAWTRLYPNKLPVTAVQLMNNDVLPTFEAQGAKIDAVLLRHPLDTIHGPFRKIDGWSL